MKRIYLYGMAMLIFIVLAGCGSRQDDGDGPVVLTIWHDKEAEVAAALQGKLDELRPDIVVTLERKSGLTETLKMVGNNPNAAPDMFFFAHDKIGVYAEMRILSPITDFVDAGVLAQFLPKTIEAATYNGVVYQLPLYFETLLFMHNRALMGDDEVPADTRELFRFMQRATGGGHFGFIEQFTNAYFVGGWIHGFGGELITADGVPRLNSPEVVAALHYYGRLVRLMPSEAEFATINTLFRESRAAATIGGPWLIPSVREAGIDLGLAPMPVVSETGMPLAPFMGVQGLHVLRVAAENPRRNEAIRTVLNHLVSTDIGVALARASGSAPALAASFDLSVIYNDEMVMMMKETAQSAIPMPNIPEMDIMWTVAAGMLVDIHFRGHEVERATETAQNRAEDLIALMR
ncbi:MAG: extracellular solute-binding protein [Defluviitaleaceae bacterium]|nr:extracellular solute-binding protein [Defluviitaleaceae bacterium]MCL2238892.1 extracellular solute-binding protein [Defluviitaleaceae bacterium]